MKEQARATVHGWEQAVNAAWERLHADMGQTPPSHQELLQRYQVWDDERGMIKMVDAFGPWEAFGPNVTVAEREAVYRLWLWEQVAYYNATQDAIDQAPGVFPGVGREGHGDNHRDAFRHAYWNTQLTEALGAEQAEGLATLHETTVDDEPREYVAESMDLHNNEVGRQLAEEHPDATPEEMSRLVQQAVRDGRMVVIDDAGQLVPSDYDFKPK